MKPKIPEALRDKSNKSHHKIIGFSVDLPAVNLRALKNIPDDARTEWRQLIRSMKKYKLFTRADRDLLEIYSRYMALWKRYMLKLDKEGILDKKGKIKPELEACNSIAKIIYRLLAQMGLTSVTSKKITQNIANTSDIPESLKEFLL